MLAPAEALVVYKRRKKVVDPDAPYEPNLRMGPTRMFFLPEDRPEATFGKFVKAICRKSDVSYVVEPQLGAQGRPTRWTAELGDEFCRRLIEEGGSLPGICAKYDDMPTYATLSNWMDRNPSFRQQVDKARETSAYAIEKRIDDEIDLVDDDNAKAKAVVLRALQWRAEKAGPRSHGRVRDAPAPVVIDNVGNRHLISSLDITTLTFEELDVLERALSKTLFRSDNGDPRVIEHVKSNDEES
jgi:hypothetical protein